MGMKASVDFIKQWEQEFLPPLERPGDTFTPQLCTSCFEDEGLRLSAAALGIEIDALCPHCGSKDGLKLSDCRLKHLMARYFSSGSIVRREYGGYPSIVSNSLRKDEFAAAPAWVQNDLVLLNAKTGWNIIPYGPRAWMYGEITPLKKMLEIDSQSEVFERISAEYPVKVFTNSDRFYRMRRNLKNPSVRGEFDSPPEEFCGKGRLDSPDFPVLYGSQDLQVCVHECRTTADDDTYVATLAPASTLRFVDLSALLPEEFSVTEFESLDLAVHMLFLAREHSYPVSRALAKFLRGKGFDGVLYPSYFSLVRTGARLFETVYGMSIRRIEQAREYAAAHVVPNVAVFGRPLAEGTLIIECLNKVILERAEYSLNFGPVGIEF
jgi:hypothetical protein